MEWYWVLAIVAGFIAMTVGLMYVMRKYKLDEQTIRSVSGIVNGLTMVMNEVAKSVELPGFEIVNLVVSLVNKSVMAAENAYYNNTITREERKNYCIDRLRDLLIAYEIELNETQWKTVDTLISAACEEMGHTVAIEECEEVAEG